MDAPDLDDILAPYRQDPTALVTALQDVQQAFHFLPADAMRRTAEALGVPLARVYAVATFYAAFSLVPKGDTVVRICKGTACHIRGAAQLEELITAEIGIRPGETSEDRRYSFEAVSCLGACAMAPVVVIDGEYHGNVRPADIRKLLKDG